MRAFVLAALAAVVVTIAATGCASGDAAEVPSTTASPAVTLPPTTAPAATTTVPAATTTVAAATTTVPVATTTVSVTPTTVSVTPTTVPAATTVPAETVSGISDDQLDELERAIAEIDQIISQATTEIAQG